MIYIFHVYDYIRSVVVDLYICTSIVALVFTFLNALKAEAFFSHSRSNFTKQDEENKMTDRADNGAVSENTKDFASRE